MDAAWWAFAAVGVVIVIDLAVRLVSLRAARRYGSAALAANALHFGGDLAGSIAVLIGFMAVRAGATGADSVAALFVAVLVLAAAGRLMRQNVGVLMDTCAERCSRRRAPGDRGAATHRSSYDASGCERPGAVTSRTWSSGSRREPLWRRRTPSPTRSSRPSRRPCPGSDVVVHVEPKPPADEALREQALAAALAVPVGA